MLRRNIILLGIVTGLLLLVVAMASYPGGSQADPHSVGYSLTNNYLSNLFSPTAINGAPNLARPWASAGMFFLALSFGLFFIRFSGKLPVKSAAVVVKYIGATAMTCAFLAVTPLHDAMIPVGSTLSLVACFYITVYVFKSKLHFFKVLSVILLLLVYTSCYLYSSRTLTILPVMQKLSMLTYIIWVLCLEYFTTPEDFRKVVEA